MSLALKTPPLNTESSTHAAAIRVLPIHLLTARERKRLGLAAKRGMGRPRRIEVPVAVDSDYVAQMQVVREAHAAADPLIAATRPDHDSDPQKTIQAAMEGIAVETAALLHDRLMGEAKGQDISVIASRRLDGLTKLAQLCLASRKLDLLVADETCPQFRKVEALWMQLLSDVAREVLPSEAQEATMSRIVNAMAAWRSSLNASPAKTSP